MNITSTSLQSVTEGAQKINSCLTDGRFDYKKAKQEASSLYQEGLKLLIAEINKQPIIKKDILPVICVLNDTLSIDTVKHCKTLHKSLSKVYRFFIELNCLHSYHQNSLTISENIRNKIIENSREILSILPENEIGARFEYRCAKQAAKCLKDVERAWKKNIDQALDIGESAEGISFFGIVKGFKGFLKEAKKDWVHEWYPLVLELRWLSAGIKKQVDFKNIIEVRLKKFQERGKEYTICLAIIFVDLIKNNDPEVSEQVRTLAAEGLHDLFILKDCHIVKKIKDKALEVSPKSKFLQTTVKNQDCYWKTRSLIIQSLEKLAKDPDCRKYIEDVLPKLIEFCNNSNQNLEKREIQKIKRKLEEKNTEYEETIENNEAVLAANEEDQRSEIDIQKIETNLEQYKKDKQRIENCLENMNLAEKVLEELHEEELGYLNRLISIQGLHKQ